jgi:hypothetical protein
MSDYKSLAKSMGIPLSSEGKPRTRDQLLRAITYRKHNRK